MLGRCPLLEQLKNQINSLILLLVLHIVIYKYLLSARINQEVCWRFLLAKNYLLFLSAVHGHTCLPQHREPKPYPSFHFPSIRCHGSSIHPDDDDDGPRSYRFGHTSGRNVTISAVQNNNTSSRRMTVCIRIYGQPLSTSMSIGAAGVSASLCLARYGSGGIST